MSDLNLKLRSIKSGRPIDKDGIRLHIEMWESVGLGPICCFYTRTRQSVGSDDQKGYVDLSDFNMSDGPPDEIVIGCSRGCVSIKNRSL